MICGAPCHGANFRSKILDDALQSIGQNHRSRDVVSPGTDPEERLALTEKSHDSSSSSGTPSSSCVGIGSILKRSNKEGHNSTQPRLISSGTCCPCGVLLTHHSEASGCAKGAPECIRSDSLFQAGPTHAQQFTERQHHYDSQGNRHTYAFCSSPPAGAGFGRALAGRRGLMSASAITLCFEYEDWGLVSKSDPLSASAKRAGS